jgi:hypothetical protein
MKGLDPMARLYDLAFGRSGDKGNIANISVIARHSAAYQQLKPYLTAQKVKMYFGAMVQGDVVRYDLDNIEAFNFVLHGALDGGGTRSARVDPLGKALAGLLLRMPIDDLPQHGEHSS